VNVGDEAASRLRRLQIAIVTVDEGEVSVRGPYSPRRLETLRALPDARFDRAAKTWTMSLHRAEAIAARAIIARSEAVAGNLPRIKGSIEQQNRSAGVRLLEARVRPRRRRSRRRANLK